MSNDNDEESQEQNEVGDPIFEEHLQEMEENPEIIRRSFDADNEDSL
jgi:hypothetical protein